MNAPTTEPLVLILEKDLFFIVKIRETLKAAGRACVVVPSLEALLARLAQTPRPAILLIHFGMADLDWQRAIQLARVAGVPVLGYGSHVDIVAQRTARAAGATRVIANSKLAADLVTQIDRTIARGKEDEPIDDAPVNAP